MRRYSQCQTQSLGPGCHCEMTCQVDRLDFLTFAQVVLAVTEVGESSTKCDLEYNLTEACVLVGGIGKSYALLE
jgi:hypothetical protein